MSWLTIPQIIALVIILICASAIITSFLYKSNKKEVILKVYPTDVYYETTIEGLTEIVLDRGGAEHRRPEINSNNFISDKKERVKTDLVLISFSNSVSTNQVTKEIEKLGYRHTNIVEFLSFCAAYPRTATNSTPFVCLGSTWRGEKNIDYMVCHTHRNHNSYYLEIIWVGTIWDTDYSFLVAIK